MDELLLLSPPQMGPEAEARLSPSESGGFREELGPRSSPTPDFSIINRDVSRGLGWEQQNEESSISALSISNILVFIKTR